jgi:hypothetical protein
MYHIAADAATFFDSINNTVFCENNSAKWRAYSRCDGGVHAKERGEVFWRVKELLANIDFETRPIPEFTNSTRRTMAMALGRVCASFLIPALVLTINHLSWQNITESSRDFGSYFSLRFFFESLQQQRLLLRNHH